MKKKSAVAVKQQQGTNNDSSKRQERHAWTFFTNHAHVLLCLAKDESLRMRDLAGIIGITERTVQQIIHDLHQEGYIHLTREGRCNRYSINRSSHLRHPIEQHKTIEDLINLI